MCELDLSFIAHNGPRLQTRVGTVHHLTLTACELLLASACCGFYRAPEGTFAAKKGRNSLIKSKNAISKVLFGAKPSDGYVKQKEKNAPCPFLSGKKVSLNGIF